MSVKLLKGGVWQPVANGKLSIKNAGVWKRPSRVYIKVGAYGSPRWVDSGYLGLPDPPTNLQLTSTAYKTSQLSFTWNAPVNQGVPPQQYHFEACSQNGQPVWGWTVGAQPTSFTIPVGYNFTDDTKYQFRVRTKSVGGLWSDADVYQPSGGWQQDAQVPGWAYLRVAIGHSAQYQEIQVTKEREWASDLLVVSQPTSPGANGGFRDEGSSLYVSPGHYVDGCHALVVCTWGAGWASAPNAGRRIYPARAGAVRFDESPYSIPDGFDGWLPWVAEWANGSTYGVYTWGDGWSWGPAQSHDPIGPYHWYGNLWLHGVEQYQVPEQQLIRAELANSYW